MNDYNCGCGKCTCAARIKQLEDALHKLANIVQVLLDPVPKVIQTPVVKELK